MASKNSTKFESEKQEKKVAEELGGKTQIASGSIWTMPSDVRNDRFLIECKTTEKRVFRLYRKTWEKIFKEATKDGLRDPVMCIDLENGKSRYAVVSGLLEEDYKRTKDFSFNLSEMTCGDWRTSICFLWYKGDSHWHTDITIMPWEDFLDYAKENYNGNT